MRALSLGLGLGVRFYPNNAHIFGDLSMSPKRNVESRPNLSTLAIVSFVCSFLVARAFTTLYPNVVLVGSGFHIHHFWYGLALLSLGGWLGISYQNERVNRLSAILFGAGGGLVGDEVGLLLTFGDYWSGITFTVVVTFLALVSILTIFVRHSAAIVSEFNQFLTSNASLYVGVFLLAVSIAFITETTDIAVTTVSSVTAMLASAIVLAYLIQRIRRIRSSN